MTLPFFCSRESRATNNTLWCLHDVYRFHSGRTYQREGPEMDSREEYRAWTSETFKLLRIVFIWGDHELTMYPCFLALRFPRALVFGLKRNAEEWHLLPGQCSPCFPGAWSRDLAQSELSPLSRDVVNTGNSQGDGDRGWGTVGIFTQGRRTVCRHWISQNTVQL